MTTTVPFFRPSVTEAEIAEVVACLRSGWLTTGPLTRRFEEDFAQAVELLLHRGDDELAVVAADLDDGAGGVPAVERHPRVDQPDPDLARGPGVDEVEGVVPGHAEPEVIVDGEVPFGIEAADA